MYKPSTYLVVTYFPTYLHMYETYFIQKLVTKVKPNINSVEVHPQLSNYWHPVDGALVGAGSLWPFHGSLFGHHQLAITFAKKIHPALTNKIKYSTHERFSNNTKIMPKFHYKF